MKSKKKAQKGGVFSAAALAAHRAQQERGAAFGQPKFGAFPATNAQAPPRPPVFKEAIPISRDYITQQPQRLPQRELDFSEIARLSHDELKMILDDFYNMPHLRLQRSDFADYCFA